MPEKPLVKQPIYQQLYERLRLRVASGEYKPGSKFLTERQVSDAYAVSRTTANKALSTLVAEGLLEFRKGLGTFVRHAGLNVDLRRLMSFTDKALSSGVKPRTEVLEYAETAYGDAPERVRNCLTLSNQPPLYHMVRLRIADAAPVILESRWVHADLCPDMTKQHVEGSIYEYWTEDCRLEIAGAEQTIRAVSLAARQAALLDTRRGTAALLVEAVGRIESGEVLWYEETLYRGDAYAFYNCLGGSEGRRPAMGKLMSHTQA